MDRMVMALIECCLHNVSSEARDVLHRTDHTVRERLCLDRCGDCDRQPFVVVDGTLELGTSHRDLLADVTTDSER